MRVCPDCGTANGDTDDFCGNCGAYVGWSRDEEKEKARDRERAWEHEEDGGDHDSDRIDGRDQPADGSRTRTRDHDRDRDGGRERQDSRGGEEEAQPEFPPLAASVGEIPTALAPDLPGLPAGLPVEIPTQPQPGFLRGLLRGFQSELPVEIPTQLPVELPAAETSAEEPAEEQRENRTRPTSPAPVLPPRPSHDPTPPPRPPVPPSPAAPPARMPQAPTEPPTALTNPTESAEPVGAVKPAKPITQRPKVRAAGPQGEQVGPPCPQCGTPNAPDRRFCRRCAAPLKPAARVVPLPWWRTVWPFRRKVRAGSGQAVRRSVIALVVLGLLVGGYFLIPAGRWLYEDVRDKLGKATHITPASTTATASLPKHGPTLATDGLSNTYWGTPKTGESLSFEFTTPFRLVDVVIHTGVSAKAEAFRNQARPTKVDLVVTAADGKVHKKTVTLADKPGPQTIQTGYSDVVSIQLTPHESAGLSEGRHIAVAEVEFFKRS
ncbi:NADase-type glycan-binding domain-containing protein [Streptomyces sp. NPDC014870]|uniref:NADase-type glycan-binding domain-containing protein n=1 Tax=Streptomyces sp. NPDC014870 TaxID=3364925 RepID=UPI00370327A7